MDDIKWMTYEDWLAQQRLFTIKEAQLIEEHSIVMTDEELEKELYYVKHGVYPE